MQQNKNKEKLTTKKLTKIFSLIWFGLVFVFTFCISSKEIREGNDGKNLIITASVVFGTLGLSIIVWLVWYLILRKKGQTENDKRIKEAIKLQKEQELKEKEQSK